MHRIPGALEREVADLAALADHVATSAHDTYTQLRGPLWATLHALGFDGGDVLVQGDGAQTLLALPGGPQRTVDFIAARMVPLRHATSSAPPQPAIRGDAGDYDLVIASLPWADVQIRDPARRAQRERRHAEMTIAAARLARPGGLVAVLATHDLMDTPDPTRRRAILQHAAFLGAVRLPAGALRRQAGNDNVVDLILFTARDPHQPTRTRPLEPTIQIPLRGGDIVINQYYDDQSEQLLGSIDVEASVWGRPSLTVMADPATLGDDVGQALENLADAALRDGLATAPPEAQTAGGPVGWAIGGARRYLPPLLGGDQPRDPSRLPEQWPTTGPESPGPDL